MQGEKKQSFMCKFEKGQVVICYFKNQKQKGKVGFHIDGGVTINFCLCSGLLMYLSQMFPQNEESPLIHLLQY